MLSKKGSKHERYNQQANGGSETALEIHWGDLQVIYLI